MITDRAATKLFDYTREYILTVYVKHTPDPNFPFTHDMSDDRLHE